MLSAHKVYISVNSKDFIDISGCRKIAISGVHSSGKTTLAKRISQLTLKPYLPEVARELLNCSKDFNWRDSTDSEVISLFEKAIFYSHLFLVKTNRDFVVDRTVIDVFVYTLIQNQKEKINSALLDLIDYFKEKIDKIGFLYDVILLMEAENSYASLRDFEEIDLAVVGLFKNEDIRELMLKVSKKVILIKKGNCLIFKEGILKV